MSRYVTLVTPLTNRKIRKSAEQAFTAITPSINFDVSNTAEVGRFLGLSIPDKIASAIDTALTEHFDKESDIFDARYFIVANLKSMVTESKPIYKIPVTLTEYIKLKQHLQKSVIVA